MEEREIIKKDKIKEIAELARIKISDEEAEKMEKDFEEIFNYFFCVNDMVKEIKKEELKNHLFEGKTVVREDKFLKKDENANDIIKEFTKLKDRYAKAPKSLKD